MKNQFNKKTIFALLAFLCIIVIIINFRGTPPAPKESDYYDGPRFNRNTGNWVTADGKIVPPPPGLANPKDFKKIPLSQRNDIAH